MTITVKFYNKKQLSKDYLKSKKKKIARNSSKNIIAVSAYYRDAVISAVSDKGLIVDNSK